MRDSILVLGGLLALLAGCALATPATDGANQRTTASAMQVLAAVDTAQVTTPTLPLTRTDTITVPGAITATAPLTAEVASPTNANAQLQDQAGNIVGTAIFTAGAAGSVEMQVEVSAFISATAGEHGIHVHQVGRCTPDFQAAGEHFNPMGAKHGLDNPEGPHAGDLPNIVFDENGNASYTASSNLLTLDQGPNSILAADGSALVIHARLDDQATDPSGRSGARIACGVIHAGTTPGGNQPITTTQPPPPVQGTLMQPQQRAPTPERIAQLQAPAGFTVTVFAQDLGNVRMMAQGADGTIYVTRRNQGDVLALRDEDGDGQAEDPILVVAGLEGVHGIIVRENQIYLATPTTVYVGDLAADGTVADLRTLVENLPEGGQHGNRTLAFGPDDLLYISVGSSCNACNETNPEHATILQVQADGSSRRIFAQGLRNTIGFGWHPETGEMWGMDHGSDWRGDNQPPEELNLLQQGSDYGWPFCYGAQQVDPYIPTNPRGRTKAEHCAQSVAPVLTYQAHSAPIGMVFYTGDQFPAEYQNDAFVAMRGSWNRRQAVGYKVVRIDFADGQPTQVEDFVSGFLLENGQAHFGRPAGLLVTDDGSLLLAEDTNGVIYRIRYLGE
jgi:glucose/arabinose dehydrogenase